MMGYARSSCAILINIAPFLSRFYMSLLFANMISISFKSCWADHFCNDHLVSRGNAHLGRSFSARRKDLRQSCEGILDAASLECQ